MCSLGRLCVSVLNILCLHWRATYGETHEYGAGSLCSSLSCAQMLVPYSAHTQWLYIRTLRLVCVYIYACTTIHVGLGTCIHFHDWQRDCIVFLYWFLVKCRVVTAISWQRTKCQLEGGSEHGASSFVCFCACIFVCTAVTWKQNGGGGGVQ